MRILVRIVLVGLALFGAGLGALALALPGIVKSDAVRERIESAGQRALGREVRFAELDFGLLPPSLVVREPSVAGAAKGDPPLVQADQLALRVALLPLIARSVVVDSLVVEGASLRLLRTAQGLQLPRLGASDPEPAAEESGGGGAGVALAVRRLSLRDTRLVVEDRSVSPAVTWELEGLELDARGDALDAPIDFDASAGLAGGGKIAAEGRLTLGSDLEVALRLDSVALAPLRPYWKRASELAGGLSGTLRIANPAAAPHTIEADLDLRDGRVALPDVALRGRLGLKAKLEGGDAGLAGPFSVDATQAELRYGEAFHKPPGRAATLAGRLVRQADGSLGVEGASLQVHNLKARGTLRSGRRVQLEAQVEPFEVRGWEELVPALAGYRASGELRPGELRLATAPLEIHGTLPLDGLRAEHPEAGPVALRGSLVARGDQIEGRDLALVAAEQTISVQARVSDLAGARRFELRTRTEKADTNRLVSAFTSRRDTFYGPLDLNGEFSGSAGGPLLRSLRGRSEIDIRDGRIVGLSLLHSTFDAIAGQGAGRLAGLGLNLAGILSGRDLSRFYGEEFQSLTGTLKLANGVASTDDMRLVYGNYSVDLRGDVGLEDGQYQMSGIVTLGPAVDAALAAGLGAEAPQGRKPHVIPIGLVGDLGKPFGVRGGNPKLRVTPDVAQSLVSRYLLDRYRDKVGGALGGGAGDALRDAIDILGRGRRPPQPQPEAAPPPGRQPQAEAPPEPEGQPQPEAPPQPETQPQP